MGTYTYFHGHSAGLRETRLSPPTNLYQSNFEFVLPGTTIMSIEVNGYVRQA